MKKIITLMMCLVSFAVGATEWTKGEIRRVDAENKKVTIKHEEIKSLDMAPMSMVFNVETTEVLKGVNPGDQVEFVAEQKGTKLFAKQFRKVQQGAQLNLIKDEMMKTVRLVNQQRRLISFGLALLPTLSFAVTEKPVITMWRGPKCGCCKDWAAYLEKNGFNVKAIDIGNTEMRQKLGMPVQFGSCHTAQINGYVIEGHVPAREIKRLLAEKPKVLGLAVPAMPLGSPGMDGPEYKGKKDPYDVLAIGLNGEPTIYQAYRQNQVSSALAYFFKVKKRPFKGRFCLGCPTKKSENKIAV